jgi:uncharacterized protein (TIGR02246 family)
MMTPCPQEDTDLKLARRLAAFATAAAFAVGCTAIANPTADERAIREGVDAWLAAFKAGDLDRLMRLYMPDAVVALHGQKALHGSDAIRAYFAPRMGTSEVEFDIEIDEIRVHGDMAYLVSRYWFTARPRDGGGAYRDAGRSVVIYRRDRDGRWKLQLDIDQQTPDVRFDAPG